jgi:hypothetical protein
MAKIRISKKDEQEYKRLIRNAKAKIRRVKKTHNIDLTDEISLPSLSSFQSRKEYNAFKEDINKFNKGLKNDYKIVKNEQGVSFTKKEIRKYEEKERAAIKNAEEYYAKTKTEQQKIFLKPSNLDIPRKKDINDISSRNKFLERLDNLTKRADPEHFNDRLNRFKENYIKSLELSFNMSTSLVTVIDMINEIPPDYFLQFYKMNQAWMDFEVYYNEDQEGSASELKKIESILETFDYDDFDLKNFPDKV